MAISIKEFEVAMEVFGAKRLPNVNGSRYSISVPCFIINATVFLHSGSYYVVKRGEEIPNEIMTRAMAEFDETHPGGNNFWWGEIHSVKGILTLACMLKGNYSRDLVNNLANETYKKLLASTLLKNNHCNIFEKEITKHKKMKTLCKLLENYSNLVNPFGNAKLNFKDPICYFDKINISFAESDKINFYTRLNLKNLSTAISYNNDSNGFSYQCSTTIQEQRQNKNVLISYYYNNGSNGYPVDKVVYLDYNVAKKGKNLYINDPRDIDLRISLNTGFAWKTYHEEEALPASEEQLDIMIYYLKVCINKIQKQIVKYMIDK